MTGIKNKIANWFYTVWDSMGNRYKWHRKRIEIIVEKRRQNNNPNLIAKKPISIKNIQKKLNKRKNDE